MRTQHTIRRIMLKYCYLFVVAGILSYILSELVVIGSEIISNAINAMFDGDNIDIEYVAGNTLLIIIISMVVTYIKSITNELFSIKVQKDCKNITVESLERVQYRFFEKNEGTIINKLTSDINDMGKLLSEIFPEILQYAVTIITISIALVKMNWLIFAGIVVTFPLVIFTSDMIAKKINDLARKRRGKYDELADIALDNIEGIEVAKAYAIEETLGLRVSSKAKEILKNEYSRNRYQALANGIVLLMKWVPSVGCSLIALFLVLKNTITIGEFMSFLVLFGKISTSLSELPFRIIDAREMLISVKRIEELLCAPKEVSGDYKGSELKNVENIIELKNVSFSYASGNTKCFENRILKDINVSIKQGEKVAIVGASGAGKSTLLKLLCGFEEVDEGDYYLCGQVFSKWDINEARRLISYVPQDSFLFPETILENLAYGANKLIAAVGPSGCGKSTLAKLLLGFYTIDRGDILIFGKSISELGISKVREQIAYVPQEPYLYNVSILDNIRYARKTASKQEVMEAAKLANAHEFISKMENGYDTVIINRGNNLSGGERQRIAIARAILKDSPVILMDEATSALDNESEQMIADSIASLKKRKTVIMIAHRKKTIQMADSIVEV